WDGHGYAEVYQEGVHGDIGGITP
ncbi:hypothetical protein EVA_15993, partial [gut metagenome]